MRLLRLRILPRGVNGWASEDLEFGADVTQLFGPNGCGKSPLIKSIVFCLGYPSSFRDDIYDHCLRAELDMLIQGTVFTARRAFTKTFDVEISAPGQPILSFYNELDYTRHLFKILNLDIQPLVAVDEKKAANPYFSSLLPIFYLDQEDGYRKFYSPAQSFLKDQASEILRILLGLPPKNAFDKKKKLIDARRELEVRDRQVYSLKKEYETAHKVHGSGNKELISQELKTLYQRLEELQSSSANKNASTEALDEIIGMNNDSIRALDRELSDIAKRDRSFQQIHAEIETEVNTLSLNEEAKRVFTSFEEICNSAGCQLFSFSSDSYGKNLLYLKDQLKDLERNVNIGKLRSEQILKRRNELKEQVASLIDKRNGLSGTSEIRALVEAVSQTSSRIFSLEQEQQSILNLETLSIKYVEALTLQDEAISVKEELEIGGQTNPSIIKFRNTLNSSMLKWMAILDTNNVSNEITFQNDFTPIFGGEKISQLGGSTRIRVILAYHAALLECFCMMDKQKISFIIFDTPKQQDMHGVDLGRFIEALKIFATATGIQIIISGTEYRYKGDSRDIDWEPKFQGAKQKMFLHEISKRPEI